MQKIIIGSGRNYTIIFNSPHGREVLDAVPEKYGYKKRYFSGHMISVGISKTIAANCRAKIMRIHKSKFKKTKKQNE